MSTFFLLALPMFLVGPGIFQNRAATPKMLSIAVGLCFLLSHHMKRRAAAHVPAFAFFGVCCLSWVFAADKWAAFAGAPKAPYYGLFGVALVILAYIGSTELYEAEDVDRTLELAGAALAVVALVQMLTGRAFNGIGLQDGRASGFRGSPVMMAASLVPCFLAAWHRYRSTWWENGRVLAMLLILGGMAAARAKGAFVAVLVGVWVYETKGFWRWAGFAAAWAMVNGVIQRVGLERAELREIAWKSFKQHPFLGWGPDCFLHALMANRTPSYDALIGARSGQASAHQDLAQIAATLGLAGLGAYLAALCKLFMALWSDGLATAVLCAMLVQAQINPLPTDVLVVIAVILGSRQIGSEGCIRIPYWVAPAVMAAAVVLALNDLTPWARRFH